MENSSNLSSKQTWNAGDYEHHARFVSDLAGAVFSLLNPQKGERILDLGCGDGVLTERIAAIGAEVFGVDLSDDLLLAAKERGLSVQKMDGHHLSFDTEFDAVFSNAALHWMSEPEKVISGVQRALKPKGRFVAEFGGHGNVAAIVTALRAVGLRYNGDLGLASPWFYPTADEYRALLEKYGFEVEDIGLFPRPTPLPTGIKGWLSHFRQPFFDQFGEDKKEDMLDEAVKLLKPSLCDCSGNWTADYVRIRVKAHLV